MAKHSGHGIARHENAEEQPVDKERAQSAHHSDPNESASHEATRDPRQSDAGKTSGSDARRR